MVKKTKVLGKVEVAFISDIPSESDRNIMNADIQHYTVIAPKRTDVFAAEIAAY
jgi:hypothetical protein